MPQTASQAQETVCNFPWLEVIKIVPSGITATVAICAFFIGRKYFNQTQKNALLIQEVNKSLDAINSTKSFLVNAKQHVERILSTNISVAELDSHLKSIEGVASGIKENKIKCLFVDGLDQTYELFNHWHYKWFVDADDVQLSLFFEVDPTKRTSLINKIGKNISDELGNCIASVDKVKKGILDHKDMTI